MTQFLAAFLPLCAAALLLTLPSPGVRADVPGADKIAPDIKPGALWDGRKMVPFKALDDPKMAAAAVADFLTDDDYVLGITLNGESRAYPTRFVWFHHFINDHVGKARTPVLVSYCSVCNTGIRYDPTIQGKTFTFDFYGLYNGIVTMYDRDTETVWLQAEGRAVKGPLIGMRLKPAPSPSCPKPSGAA